MIRKIPLPRSPEVAARVLAHHELNYIYNRVVKSELFDAVWYRNKYLNAAEDFMIDPLGHYLFVGGFRGAFPNRVFDSGYYLESNPNVSSIGVNPLVH